MRSASPLMTSTGVFLLMWACSSKEDAPKDPGCMSGICASGATGGSSGGAGGAGGATAGKGSGGKGTAGTSTTGGTSSGGMTGEAGDTSSGGSAGTATATGGKGGSGTGGASGGSAGKGGSAGSGPCAEAWTCSSWQTNGSSDDATRTCTDANDCGTTAQKPTEAVTLPALDMNYYKCNVEPIMNNKCSMLGCHGTEQGRALRLYSRGRLRITGEMLTDSLNSCLSQGMMFPTESCTGSIECRCYFEPHTATEWQRNFDSARGFALDATGNPIAAPDDSELIAQPIVGGKAHAGIHLFRQDDADHDKLRRWLNGETLASCNTNN
jgi:hypothetical protein